MFGLITQEYRLILNIYDFFPAYSDKIHITYRAKFVIFFQYRMLLYALDRSEIQKNLYS